MSGVDESSILIADPRERVSFRPGAHVLRGSGYNAVGQGTAGARPQQVAREAHGEGVCGAESTRGLGCPLGVVLLKAWRRFRIGLLAGAWSPLCVRRVSRICWRFRARQMLQEMPNAVWKEIFVGADSRLETIKHPETVKEVRLAAWL